jgi:2-iminobutanoate/2-iminopropanoate deaminase
MSRRVKLTVVFVLALTTSLALARDKKDKADKHAAAPQAVATQDAPQAIGPYSQGMKAGEFVFAAGQLGRDPATAKLVEGGIAEQTDRALKNLSAVLTAAGTSMDKVVKTTVFLKNISDFGKMNEVYATYFKTTPPARTTIGVAALPGDALVEIDVVALQ